MSSEKLEVHSISGMAAIPCTCGELFQGTLDGEPCLVSCPINIFSMVNIMIDKAAVPAASNRKAYQALESITNRAGKNIGIAVNNPLPVGRGYGTSTADIGAVLFAASRALNLNLTAFEAAQIAIKIEPTDSTFFTGITLFDHRSGRFYQSLGHTPAGKLIILDPGGMVDSEAFNARDLGEPLLKLANAHRNTFQLLEQGIMSGDLAAIGEAATLSAKYHQAILFNPLVDMALSFVKQLGAVGICRAHSGTIVGLIFPEDYDHENVPGYITRFVPAGIRLREAALTGGGPIYFSPDGIKE